MGIVGSQSVLSGVRAARHKPIVRFEKPYGQAEGDASGVAPVPRIVLVALYQKGVLRPDVVRLLRAAKAAGHYVLAVNTLKLKDPKDISSFVDCYVERPNFGRDFGSYKTGFLHIFRRGWQERCPRLLMLNDSVFYTEERLEKFLDDMMSSDVEVLGSTENFEIEYHLGSFCIAMSGTILRNPKLAKYWRSYRNSDVRPLVIRRGEMGLTKALKRCVTSPDQFRALYGSERFLNDLLVDHSLTDFAIRNSRTSDLVGWKPLTWNAVIEHLQLRFIVPIHRTEDVDFNIETTLRDINEYAFVHGYDDLFALLGRHLTPGSEIDPTKIADVVRAVLAEVFMQGSQIHQNAATLLRMGLPFVKLDGLYRGAFNIYDMVNVTSQMTAEEAGELRQLLLVRPYGGATLRGWKRAAFMRGLV